MSIIVPPSTPYQVRTNHPSKPEMGEDEDYVDYIVRCCDHWITDPPVAPKGFDLVECTAEPRHFPLYMPVDDDLYPGHCLFCERDSMAKTISKQECRLEHRRWKSWKILGWLQRKSYALGVTRTGGVSYGRCEHCGIGRQYMRPRFRGKRVYILYVQRDTWVCLLKHHHRPRRSYITGEMCTVCLPCPDCGSTDPTHYSCEASA